MHPDGDHKSGIPEAATASKKAAIGFGGWLVVFILLVFLGVSIWFAVDIWYATGEVEISTHGKIAMVLGVVLTFVLGAGLMALLFWSNRKGFDR
jgi:hypothetical protein